MADRFKDDEMLTKSMATTAREKIRRPRPGQSTWATFRFLYRDEGDLILVKLSTLT